jgi:RNA methyltransferase, TrmH family
VRRTNAASWVYGARAVCYAWSVGSRFSNSSRPGAGWAPSAGGHVNDRADPITSRDNKWLRLFRAALRGTGPSEGDPIGVEGPKMVEDALRTGLEAEAVLVSETGSRELERILRAASESEAGIPRSRILRTTDKLFKGVAGTDTPQGVAALFRQPERRFDDLLRGVGRQSLPLMIVLAAVQDPGNVGTILRSAESFGATGVVAVRGSADPWSPKALRASAGSALRLPVLRGIAFPAVLGQLRIAGVRLYVASSLSRSAGPKATANLAADIDLREPAAIFIGNEGSGVPEEVVREADATISIPTCDAVESLNAGVAASILLYEAARQRQATTISGKT